MTITVNKASVIENIFKNFYDILVTISGFSTIVYPEFPDVIKDSTSDFPIVILNPADVDFKSFTLGKSVMNGTISIDIYQTTAKDADLYCSDVIDKIESSKGTLAGVGIREIEMQPTAYNQLNNGKIKIHNRTLTFNFKFYYTKSFTY